MIERACAGKWGEHHWPRVPNAEGERQAMRAALEAVGLLEAKTQDHEPSLDGLPLGPHAYRLRLAREREDAARHDQDARVTGLLIDLARMEVSEAREGHRYELDHDRGWMRATLAEGTYIGPDPEGSGSRDSVRRATDTDEGHTG